MNAIAQAHQYEEFRRGPDAWRQPDVAWAYDDLIELVAATATCDSPSVLVSSALGFLIPADRVLSWAVISVDANGSLHRARDSSPNLSLSARAATWLWSSESTPSGLRDGAAIVETWRSDGGAEALVCVPLLHEDILTSLIAVWFSADDTEALLRDASRLTVLGRLWTTAQALCEVPGERGRSTSGAGLKALTARQLVILRAMGRGLTNAQIARQINFSESTVRLESMSIYRHFGVHSRFEAVVVARRAGVL